MKTATSQRQSVANVGSQNQESSAFPNLWEQAHEALTNMAFESFRAESLSDLQNLIQQRYREYNHKAFGAPMEMFST